MPRVKTDDGKALSRYAWVSHTDVGPLSRPTRTTLGVCLRIRRAMALGSDVTLPSKTHVPFWLRRHTLVSLSDTSSPTKVSMATPLGK